MPPPMDKKSYRKTFTKLYRAYSNVAYQLLKIFRLPLKQMELRTLQLLLMARGSEGYSSLNGVVTCISEGKVLDYEVLCKVCPQCKYWNKKKTTAEYEEWKLYHDYI